MRQGGSEPSLKGYRWHLCAKHRFTAAPAAGLSLSAQLYENRGESRPREQWLAVRYLENGAELPQPLELVSIGARDPGCPWADPR